MVDLDCSGDAGSSKTCFTKADRYNFVTRQEPAPLSASSACSDNAQRNKSWAIEGFSRHYDQNAASETTEKAITFTLRSLSNSGVFNCTLSGAQKATQVDGTCEPTAGKDSTAKFRFDSTPGFLTITQSWSCDGSSK